MTKPTEMTAKSPTICEACREQAASVIENGRFLHDQAPTALFAKEASAAIRALPTHPAATGEAPAAPAGRWRWVPVEPTEEMMEAGQACDCEGEDDALRAYGMIYKAMLAAAPAHPKAPVAVVDDFHRHEVVDRVAMVQRFLDSSLDAHPALAGDKELENLLEKSHSALYELYQAAAMRHMDIPKAPADHAGLLRECRAILAFLAAAPISSDGSIRTLQGAADAKLSVIDAALSNSAPAGEWVMVPREKLEYISKLPDSYPVSAIRSMVKDLLPSSPANIGEEERK